MPHRRGDLKADPADLLARSFDLHVHQADRGTRRVLFRLPAGLVDLDDPRAYLTAEQAYRTAGGDHVVVDPASDLDEGDLPDDRPGDRPGRARARREARRA